MDFIEIIEKKFSLSWWTLVGLCIVCIPATTPILRDNGFSSIGLILGIVLVVCSLFGELPSWISWIQRFGMLVFSGIAIGTIILLIPLLIPNSIHETSLLSISPSVWGAYISIVLVSISFSVSTLPKRIYLSLKKLSLPPYIAISLYVILAGLAGNILDGVTIISLSTVIFLHLLEEKWAVKASFALLFGGLISNLITVAAEPTNIKFQDVLSTQLNKVSPPYWATNWPISIFGILLPAGFLAFFMFKENVKWKKQSVSLSEILRGWSHKIFKKHYGIIAEVLFSSLAIFLLAAGIIAHSVLISIHVYMPGTSQEWPLWLLLLPSGIVGIIHISSISKFLSVEKYLNEQWPVWGKLMIIFSLLWLISDAYKGFPNILSFFLFLPFGIRYGFMIVLSLLSSVTDNVALASMQGALITGSPIPVIAIRIVFMLLTWAGGLTYFGCLQSLALNSFFKLNTKEWFRQTPLWAILAVSGGFIGIGIIAILYPSNTQLISMIMNSK